MNMNKRKLDYSILYNPSENKEFLIRSIEEPYEYNYLYKDNYLHVRLNKFGNKSMRIKGFEDKLSFVITYLINKLCEKNLMNKEFIREAENLNNFNSIWNKCLNEFYSSPEYDILQSKFKSYFPNFKGIKILPMYSKKNKPKNCLDYLGECVNLNIDNPYANSSALNNNELAHLNFYFNLYEDNDFIYDDSYEIIIEKKIEINKSKFLKKHKEKQADKINVKEIYLW